jgi:hypothetical protein
MIKRIIQLGFVSLMMVSAAWAQQPRGIKVERDDFFREIVNKLPSPRTVYYDQTITGSYQVTKLDTLRGLPDAAKAQSLDLRGAILIGPYGPTNLVYVYAFFAEKTGIRVNQLTMSQARFTYKSTGTMTRAQYDTFFNNMIKTNVLRSGLPDDESKYETLFARWSNGALETYYGSSITPPPGSNVNEYGKLLNRLLVSLAKTYPLKKGPTTR